MSRYASHFPQALSCFDLTNRWISPWLLTLFVVSFCLSYSYKQRTLTCGYFQLSAFCRSCPRMRGLNIRSISMDFRFESPGECWALWKDSERATKDKTSKHQRKKKKNQFLMINGPKVTVYLFFQDTHKTTSVNTNIVIRFCGVISVCKLWHKVKISFPPPYCTLNTRSRSCARNWTTVLLKFPFLIYNNFSLWCYYSYRILSGSVRIHTEFTPTH